MEDKRVCERCGAHDGERYDGKPIREAWVPPGARFCVRCESDLRREMEAKRIVAEWEAGAVESLRADSAVLSSVAESQRKAHEQLYGGR